MIMKSTDITSRTLVIELRRALFRCASPAAKELQRALSLIHTQRMCIGITTESIAKEILAAEETALS